MAIEPLKYIRKQPEVEAVQWSGTEEDARAIIKWVQLVAGATMAYVSQDVHPLTKRLMPQHLLVQEDNLKVYPFDYVVWERNTLWSATPATMDADFYLNAVPGVFGTDEELSKMPIEDKRDPRCIEEWPDCVDGEYNPRCCRFPKSCSCES